MGVSCEACGKVHFVTTSPAIELSRAVEGIYRLTCTMGCSAQRKFKKHDLRAYQVSDEAFRRGYANVGDYEMVVVLQPRQEL